VLAEPLDAKSAALALAELQGGAADEEFLAYVANLLARLEDLGLVHRCADG
jgi:hypothetical protein